MIEKINWMEYGQHRFLLENYYKKQQSDNVDCGKQYFDEILFGKFHDHLFDSNQMIYHIS